VPALSRLRALALALAETLLQQRPTWRPLGLAAAWVVLMLAATQIPAPLKGLDWQLLAALDAGAKQWPSNVEIIDLEWDADPAHTDVLRRRVAAVLEALAKVNPRIVVVDVTLNTLPIELPALQAAVIRLGKEAGVPIIAAVGPENHPAGMTRQEAQRRLGGDPALYGGLAEFGHTDFIFDEGQQPSYKPCAKLHDGGCLPSVPALVVAKLLKRNATEDAGARPVIFAPGAAALRQGHVWQLQGGRLAQAGDPGADMAPLRDCIVIVGNLAHDRAGPWAGPELLAWAIADAVAPRHAPHVTLLRHPAWAVVSALVCSGVTLGLFVLLRRGDPRGHRIGLAALAGAAAALASLAGAVWALRTSFDIAHYQVAYSLVGIAIAALLGWRAAAQAVLRRALYTSVSDARPDTPPRWDVFVSYSHSPPGNIARVREQIVEPLRRLRVGDRPMEVFFDESAIRVGLSWYTELAEGIERSSCVVAVYTSDYFRKSFCLFEMRKAVVRDIADRGQTFHVLPIQLDPDVVPPVEFNHLQYGKDMDPGRVVQTVCKALQDLRVPVL
jgi:hypothetical protein